MTSADLMASARCKYRVVDDLQRLTSIMLIPAAKIADARLTSSASTTIRYRQAVSLRLDDVASRQIENRLYTPSRAPDRIK